MLRDTFLIALYAAIGAGVAGLLGVAALRLLRNRSVALSLAVVTAVAVAAMPAGTMLVSWAMLLSDHDLWVVTMVCSIAAVVSFAVALVLGRSVVKGSRALAEATRALGDDGRFTPPRTAPTAELAQLVRELVATSAKVAASRERERTLEESRRELVAWISHDLRTPLAGLQAMTEALEDGMVDDPSVYHARIRTEVERLSEMVSDLFELSRIQAGVLALNTARISVYDLVGDGVEPLPIEVDGREMSRVLADLLVNAIHRTPTDGTVAVSAQQEDGGVVVSVADGCGGIPTEDLSRVFDTGWRGTDARTPLAGAGLRLAIVRGIVEAHSGRAAVHNVPGGCRFEVRLPTAA
jgi:signal transduction histidine kinase